MSDKKRSYDLETIVSDSPTIFVFFSQGITNVSKTNLNFQADLSNMALI